MGFNYTSFGLLTSDVVGFTPSQRTAIELQATISIVNEGKLEYKNLRYPRFKQFYGYAQLMSGAYVEREIPLNYLNQELCHWQESSPAINQGIGCATKKILAALTPPSEATVKVGLLRQRFTSIRFRLLPDVTANIGLNWHVLDPLCDDEIVQPPAKQGEPVPPNNGNSDPGQRPSNQGGDPVDKSDNDGNYDPGDGNPPPPVPGGGTNFPCWHWSVMTVYLRCDGDLQTFNYTAYTNPLSKPYYVSQKANAACPNATDGVTFYNDAPAGSAEGIIGSGSWSYY